MLPLHEDDMHIGERITKRRNKPKPIGFESNDTVLLLNDACSEKNWDL